MLDSSRTVHAVLSNNCSTLHWSDKTYAVHTVSTKTTHSWTWLGRSLTSQKQSLKHHQLSPNKYTRQHVYLRTLLRREHRMLFAEIDSQGGRSTPTSLQSTPFSSLHATSFALAQQAVVRDLWIWRTLVVRRSLPVPSVRTEHTPIDLTHTLLDFPLSVLNCTSALARVCRLHTPQLLMVTRQNSIAFATALLDSAFIANVGSSQPLPPLLTTCRCSTWTSTHSPAHRHSHPLFVTVRK